MYNNCLGFDFRVGTVGVGGRGGRFVFLRQLLYSFYHLNK